MRGFHIKLRGKGIIRGGRTGTILTKRKGNKLNKPEEILKKRNVQ